VGRSPREGADGSLTVRGWGGVVCMADMFILNEIWTLDEIYILW
jgi:hypothetical protein